MTGLTRSKLHCKVRSLQLFAEKKQLADHFCIILQGSNDKRGSRCTYFSPGKIKPPTRQFYYWHFCHHIEEMQIKHEGLKVRKTCTVDIMSRVGINRLTPGWLLDPISRISPITGINVFCQIHKKRLLRFWGSTLSLLLDTFFGIFH